MSFDVAADAYDRFMGRYSQTLAPQMANLAGGRHGDRVLDVGCGPGALTSVLVERFGRERVVAVDPSEPFVDAARTRHPGVDVRHASAEQLPFDDGTFDAALAQLVVHFMSEPVTGIGEMRRVTRPGGTVVACVWDHAGGLGPLGLFWRVARELDPGVRDESDLPGARAGHLEQLFADAGLRDIEPSTLVADRTHPTFEDWWDPFEHGVGPAGAYVATLDVDARARLRDRCRATLPDAPFTIPARAWAVRAIA